MKLSDVMARHPLVVDRTTPNAELVELMETGRVHHLPLMDGDEVVGLWLASESGALVLVGPDRIEEMDVDDDAADAMRSLLDGAEAVVAREEGRVAGVLTQSDVAQLVQNALARGIGQRTNAAVVIRLIGPEGAGKSTLLMRTIPLMRTCDVGVVGGPDLATRPAQSDAIEGAPLVVEEDNEREGTLMRAVRGLGDVQVVFVEGRDELPETLHRPPCDYLAVVVPANEVDSVTPELLRMAEVVVVTKLDVAPPGFDLALARDRLQEMASHVDVIGVAAAADARGLDVWRRWLRSRVLPRRH